MRISGFFVAILATILPCILSFPLLHSTRIQSNGSLRPKALVSRQLNIITVNEGDGGSGSSASASSGTGSSTSSVGVTGSSSSSESASQDSTSSSSSSCGTLSSRLEKYVRDTTDVYHTVILGGCSSSAATACPLDLDNSTAVNSSTSSSLCGSGSSTDSGPALLGDSPLISLGGKLVKRAAATLAMSKA